MKTPTKTDVEIFDTTLRDGTQGEGISLSCDDKLRIARRLDSLGATFIEGGWPGSNPKDALFFEKAREEHWSHATICAFGATRRARSHVEADPGVAALLAAETKVCTIFGKSWTLQVTDVLNTTLEQNLELIEDTISYLVGNGRRVIYDAEHFFDGFAADPAYALETLAAAKRGGAETLVLCDTNGGTMPWDVDRIVRVVAEDLKHPLGIHAHDDSGLAVANSLAAVRAGARHVQGTINGYGERCGNANLCAIVPDLELKMGFTCLPEDHLSHLYEVSHYVAEVANLSPDDHMAYVGRSAFAHKGGVHVAAMRKNPRSYQHVDPGLVGNEMRTVVSELSGRGNVLTKAEEMGLSMRRDTAADVVEHIKLAESRGFSFEAAEASVELMLHRREPGYEPPFRVVDYKVLVGSREDETAYAEATVKVVIGDQAVHTAAEGNGPVQALDAALRKALSPAFPAVSRIHLKDYKVRILDGRHGTSSTTRVLIDSTDDHDEWSTVGASGNIIEASCQALLDSIEYGLLRRASRRASSLPPQKKAASA